TWPAKWSTSRSSRSCSKPARPCWRRQTRPRRECFRSSARPGTYLRGTRAPRGTDHTRRAASGPPVCVPAISRLRSPLRLPITGAMPFLIAAVIVLSAALAVSALLLCRARAAARAERIDNSRMAILAQEDERRRVARELHDEVGQSLTALVLELDRAGQALGAVGEALAPAREVARACLEHTR